MHPLTPDLTQLSDEELHKKVNELTQRLTQSYRMASYEMAGQIHMIMEDYQSEVTRRQQKQMEELMSKSDKFSGIIDVK